MRQTHNSHIKLGVLKSNSPQNDLDGGRETDLSKKRGKEIKAFPWEQGKISLPYNL